MKPITIDVDGAVEEALGTMKISDGVVSVNGVEVGQIEIPDDMALRSAKFQDGKLVLTVSNEDGSQSDNIDVQLYDNVDLSKYLTKEMGDALYQPKGEYLTEHQDLSDYAKKVNVEEELDKLQVNVNAYTDNKISAIVNGAPEALDTLYELSEAVTANKDIVDTLLDTVGKKANTEDVYNKNTVDALLTDYITNEKLDKLKLASEEWVESKNYLTQHQDLSEYAKKTDIPTVDLTPYETKLHASETYQEKGNYALKEDIPSLNGYATETFVTDKINEIEFPSHEDLVTNEKLDEKLEAKQNKGNYIEYNDINNRKIVTLNNADIFGATANEEPLKDKVDINGWVSLMQLNKWNVVDLGSPKTITNINTPKGERPTVQEAGQSGTEAHKMAYLDDVPSLEGYAKLTDIPTVDLTPYETKENAEATYQPKGNYLIEHQDLSDYVKASDLVTELNTLQDNANTYTDNKISAIVNGAPEALDTLYEISEVITENKDTIGSILETIGQKANSQDVYNKGDVDVLLNEYASKEYLSSLNYATQEWVEDKNYLTEHQDLSEYAKKTDIPTIDLTPYETKDNAAATYQIKGDYVLRSEVPSLDGYATETFVTDKINEIEFPSHDDFVTKASLENELKTKQDKGDYLTYSDSNGRKIVTLNNADIFGAVANDEPLDNKIDIHGWVSLMQLNKWNVVDLGSPKTITNINTPKNERPTVQEAGTSGSEAHKIAYVDDIPSLDDYAKLTDIPSIDLTPYDTVESVDAKLAEKQDKGNYLEFAYEKKNPQRKVITLNNTDVVMGKTNQAELEGKVEVSKSSVTLMQVNAWNVCDFGSPWTLTNINTPDGIRPTVQEKSQSGAEAHKMAYLDDVTPLLKQIEDLKSVVDFLTKTNENSIIETVPTEGTIKTSGNILVSGHIVNPINNVTPTTYRTDDGNIMLHDFTVENTPLIVNAQNGNIEINNFTCDGVVSDGSAEVKKNNMSLYSNESIIIKNSTFDQQGYNGFLINNNGAFVDFKGDALAKNITFENVIMGNTTNNGIVVIGTDENAVITIKDVKMGNVKNAVRFSNYKDKRGIIVNLENIEVESVREKFMLLEDYRTRKVVDGGLNYPDDTTDLFDTEHMIFNFKNVTVSGVKLTADMDKTEILHVVVGKPSLGADVDVTDSCKDNITFNFE